MGSAPRQRNRGDCTAVGAGPDRTKRRLALPPSSPYHRPAPLNRTISGPTPPSTHTTGCRCCTVHYTELRTSSTPRQRPRSRCGAMMRRTATSYHLLPVTYHLPPARRRSVSSMCLSRAELRQRLALSVHQLQRYQ